MRPWLDFYCIGGAVYTPAVYTARIARIGAIVVAVVCFAPAARAHAPDLSVADFDVHPDGQVEAEFTFASTDMLGGIELDRDRDGVVTPAEVFAASDDLRAFATQQVGVEADGTSCDASFRDASLTEVDGLAIRANYVCPSDAAEIEVTLYYLSGPSRATPRRGIIRMTAGAATADGVLTGDHRAMALRRPETMRPPARRWARLAAFAVGAIVVAFLAWSMSRWREARAAWQNRPP